MGCYLFCQVPPPSVCMYALPFTDHAPFFHTHSRGETFLLAACACNCTENDARGSDHRSWVYRGPQGKENAARPARTSANRHRQGGAKTRSIPSAEGRRRTSTRASKRLRNGVDESEMLDHD